MNLSNQELEYIADLIDRYGSIYASSSQLTLQISSCNGPLIRQLGEYLNCSVDDSLHSATGETYWTIKIFDEPASRLLSLTLPFLSVKNQTASLGISFVSEEDREKRANIRSLLNKSNMEVKYESSRT